MVLFQVLEITGHTKWPPSSWAFSSVSLTSKLNNIIGAMRNLYIHDLCIYRLQWNHKGWGYYFHLSSMDISSRKTSQKQYP